MRANEATERTVATRQGQTTYQPRKLSRKLVRSICDRVALLQRSDLAAAEEGLTRDTYRRWVAEGARLRHQLAGDPGWGPPPKTLTSDQRLLVELSERLESAYAVAETRVRAQILKVGSIPQKETRTVTRTVTVAGQPSITTTETTETVRPPDWRALAWLGERKLPGEFRPVVEVELGEETRRIEERAAEAADRLRRFLEAGGPYLLPPVGESDADVVDGEVVDGEVVDGTVG